MYNREMINLVLENLGVIQVNYFNLKFFERSEVFFFFLLDDCIKRCRWITFMYCIYFWNQRIIIIRWNTIGCLSSMRLELNKFRFFSSSLHFVFFSFEPPLRETKKMPIWLCRYNDHPLIPLTSSCFFFFSILLIILEHVVVFVCFMLVPLSASSLLLSLCLVSNKLFFKILCWSYSFFFHSIHSNVYL